jgi:hypothetical protein
MARRSCVRAAAASMLLDGRVTRLIPEALRGALGGPRLIAASGLASSPNPATSQERKASARAGWVRRGVPPAGR